MMRFLGMIFLAFSIFTAQAQTYTGYIVDEFQEPLANAYVYNTMSKSHAHSNDKGWFELDDSQVGDVIQIGLLGFKKIEFVLEPSSFSQAERVILETKVIQLKELRLYPQKDAVTATQSLDVALRPVNSSQETLRRVPGLIIGQHAGGGKAEQLFLRGFDLDHGTDIRISVDDVPVNMVSHAHGQGYSDLHFLIPETIQHINFGKGPYEATQGDFSTAGFVALKTKNQLDKNQLQLSTGQFNTNRALGMFSLLDKKSPSSLYIALEHLGSEGPFESPQNLRRTNSMLSYHYVSPSGNSFTFKSSYFHSTWSASGQIPERAVARGTIGRFGAIDDTEGGRTGKKSAQLAYKKYINDDTSVSTKAFISSYDFELFSNFTFFLLDPQNGDQIKQKENRIFYGVSSTLNHKTQLWGVPLKLSTGLGFRSDRVNNLELSRTINKTLLKEPLQLGKVHQTNPYAFAKARFSFDAFQIIGALRYDYFSGTYVDDLSGSKESTLQASVISPKVQIQYQQNEHLQWYIKGGVGFHSNDTRVVLSSSTNQFLPKAYGLDVGSVYKLSPSVVLSSALWYLHSEDELVYVGDEGIVEASGASRRMGVDLGIRYQVSDSFYMYSDATYTYARSLDSPKEANYIPLAPDFTLTGGVALTKLGRFSGSFQYRFLDDRPANEDNSIVARGYFISDLAINYELSPSLNLGMFVENIFNSEWNETQFATTSQLQNEVTPTEEIHFTPGTPFQFKMSITYTF